MVAYREALKELTQERVPLEWAMAQSYLGVAMTLIAERRNDLNLVTLALSHIEVAVGTFREAGQEFYADASAAKAAKTQSLIDNLCKPP